MSQTEPIEGDEKMNAPVRFDEHQKQFSVIRALADRYEVGATHFEKTVRKLCMPERFSEEDFIAFLIAANIYRLNPLQREIYAIKRGNAGIQVIVGVDGWAKIINREPQFDGVDFEYT